jgi:F-type H+-transporting ATPase subunit gamma
VEFYKRSGRELIAEYPYFSETAKASRCADISSIATDMFKSGEVDEVKVFYTAFVSAMQQDPTGLIMLPFEPKSVGRDAPDTPNPPLVSTHYDPSPEAVFDRVIPKLLLSVINGACVESFASEQVARRNAMENASDNAEEMIDNLSLQYNRARQEKITNEINEIVGGANAIS